MIIGNKNFDFKNGVYVMGILNVTPDSFSDGGNYNNLDKALYQTEKMINDGADIIDVGGESTRPGHIQISDEEEIERILPILKAIKSRFDIPISLDTYKSAVLSAAKDYVDLANDIWGLKYDPNIARVIAQMGIPCCIMHNRKKPNYTDFFNDLISDLDESIKIAERAGISKDKIILDGGVGFQKSYEQNLSVIKNTDKICELGYPTMIATSKKSVVGLTIDKKVDERTIATVATTVVGVMKGASIVRVHDIVENVDAIKMTKSIMEGKKWTL